MNIEKVKQIAKEKYGKELTYEQAAAFMEKYGKLSDDELDNVSGGCIDEGPAACRKCGAVLEILTSPSGSFQGYRCPNDC